MVMMRALTCTTAWPSQSTAQGPVLTQLPLVPVLPCSKAAADVLTSPGSSMSAARASAVL